MAQARARRINDAVFDAALSAGASLLQARILAGRLDAVPTQGMDSALKPSLASLGHPSLLVDMEKAVDRLALAIEQDQRIGVLTDYDVDGVTSHWVIIDALTRAFNLSRAHVSSWIGHRIHDGYGISQTLVDRILAEPLRPDVILTADCGSSDEPRIAQLAAAGIDVIVGDHHAIPESGIPESAFAVINPTRHDCQYPDASIAGVMVSWLIMSGLRQRLIDLGRLPATAPKLSSSLDAVALGTVADCVDLGGSAINRAVVNFGLDQINKMQRPMWQALAASLGEDALPVNAETLGFQMGPRINARGRIDDPMAALYLMMAQTEAEAARHLQQLTADNEERKAIERAMVDSCAPKAHAQRRQGRFCAVVADDQGHPGVQGIVASRLTDQTGLPSVVLAPSQTAGFWVGSMRSVPGIHARQALQECHQWLDRFGGHAGAAGLTIAKTALVDFAMALDEAIKLQVDQQPVPIKWHDGELNAADLNPDLMNEIAGLQPYGRGFESPTFVGTFDVISTKIVGKDPVHLSLNVSCGEGNSVKEYRTVWFRALSAPGAELPVQSGQRVRLLWRPVLEKFRGQERLVPRIEGLDQRD